MIAGSTDRCKRTHNRPGPHVAGRQVRGDVLQQQREGERGPRGDQVHGDGGEEQPEAAREQHGEQQHAVLAIAARLQRPLALPERAGASAWPQLRQKLMFQLEMVRAWQCCWQTQLLF